MPNSPRVSVGFLLCLIVGVIVCGIGISTSRNIKAGDVDCTPNSTVGDDQSVKPTNNSVAICLAEAQADSQAKVASKSAFSYGLILGGVAIMIAGVGFSIMDASGGSSQPSGPRPVFPPQQLPTPGQPFPGPPQERP
jgi:hypothetical protein